MTMQTILIVDDDDKILKILRHCLEKEGFRVVTAAEGRTALALGVKEKPDLAVVDLMLPGISGLEVCRQLLEERDIPVIILSAKGDEVDKVVGFRMGVDDYMTKPFSPVELVLRVQAVLRRSAGRKGQSRTPLQAATGLAVELQTRTVLVEGVVVEVTNKEFELLWVLISHPNQVFTRMQLLREVWNSEYPGDENTVTVHVRRLREKIERDPANPRYIKTVWGVGYKVVL